MTDTINRSDLRNKIEATFDLTELRSICFELGVDFENLAGNVKRTRIESLIAYMENRGRLPHLLAALQSKRPHVNWDNRPPAELPCPYRGLLAFREEDAAVFFGRQTFIERLITATTRQSLVTVIGPSGSGKSSVVYAGLVPYLRQNGAWLISHFRPGKNPYQSLSAALLPLLEPAMSKTARLVEENRLAKALSEDQLTLLQVVDQIQRERENATHFLLVVDQFEELYTLTPGPEIRHHFLDQLLTLANADSNAQRSAAKLLLTLRADFLSQALAYRPFSDALQDADVKLGPMNREELRQVIELPVVGSGVSFEAGLVERILDDVGLEPGNLPLLQFAMTLLWDRQVDGRLSHAAYKEIGRVEGALAQYADEAYEALEPDEQAQARRLFVQLVQPGGGTEDTRRLATQTELGIVSWDVVRNLANARLVVTNQDTSGQETVEVAHEALINDWKRLRQWMETDRAFRSWQEQLRVTLYQWQQSGEDADALLRGGPLAEAESWLTRRQDDLSPVERQFIMASLAGRRRYQRLRSLAVVGLLVITVVMAILAISSATNARRVESLNEDLASTLNEVRTAQARAESLNEDLASTLNEVKGLLLSGVSGSEKLASDAIVATAEEDDYALVLLLAIEADSIEETEETHEAIRNALDRHNYSEPLKLNSEERFTEAMWHPQHDQILTVNEEGIAEVWELQGTTLAVSFTLDETDVEHATWNVDGSQILAITREGSSKIWDAEGKDSLSEFELGLYEEVKWYSDDNGFYILTKGHDGVFRLWNDALKLWHTFNDTETTSAQKRDSLARMSKGRRLLPYFYGGEGGREPAPGDYTEPCEFSEDSDNSRLALNKDRTQFLAVVDGRAMVWDVESETKLIEFNHQDAEVTGAAWSPDGRRIFTIDENGNTGEWDAEQNWQQLQGNLSDHPVSKIVWNGSGGLMFTISSCSQAGDDPVQVFEDGEMLRSLEHGKPVYNVLLNSDESRILTVGSDDIVVWDVEGARLYQQPSVGQIGQAAWNHDGDRILTITKSDGENPRGAISIQVSRVYIPDLVELACENIPPDVIAAGREYLNLNSYEPSCDKSDSL